VVVAFEAGESCFNAVSDVSDNDSKPELGKADVVGLNDVCLMPLYCFTESYE
jgi:hypothetical protein